MVKFSVITIVRNDPTGVLRTLRSVFAQTWQNYELIVQDGASTDGTSDILHMMESWIDTLVIEPDAGIYDAMNRALRRATGDYLVFMNADDLFHDAKVLERVAAEIDPDNDDFVSGQAVRDEDGVTHRFRPPDKYWIGNTADHQATFIRREIMQELEYDLQFKVSADLHFFSRARKKGYKFRDIGIPIVRKPFAEGASSSFAARMRDRYTILTSLFGDEFPVHDTLVEELRSNMARSFDIDRKLLADMSLEELLARHDEWSALGLG